MNFAGTHTTPYRLVTPFYVYAAFSFLAANILLVLSSDAFTQHYFNPPVLAVTHIMALGWGTMMILGASHQLIPVLTGCPLANHRLAVFSFALPAAGIPLLVYAFYVFDLGWPARAGGILVNAGLLCYLINLTITINRSRNEPVAVVFVLTATCWLLLTTLLGLLLVYNFRYDLLPADSLHYLTLHAHTGMAGWFLLMVLGIGSKLIPMFLISKFQNNKLLWAIYFLVNLPLLGLLASFFFLDTGRTDRLLSPDTAPAGSQSISAPILLLLPVLVALGLFGYYCKKAYDQRIRRKVDLPVKFSLLAVGMTAIPVLLLVILLVAPAAPDQQKSRVLAYGFSIFFGWMTTIILGMTFKTLPFIVWNRIYRNGLIDRRIPDPASLYRRRLFSAMSILYIGGFLLFTAGIATAYRPLLRFAAVISLIAALLYAINVWIILQHKPLPSSRPQPSPLSEPSGQSPPAPSEPTGQAPSTPKHPRS